MAAMTRRYLFVSTIQGRMRPSEVAIGHVRNYSAIELRAKLERAGLEVLGLSGWGFPFYSPLYRSLVSSGSPGGHRPDASRESGRSRPVRSTTCTG